MKIRSALLVVVTVCWLGAMSPAAGPKSIFDDDWVPPSRGEAAKPAPVKPIAPVEPPKVDPAKTDPPKVETAPATPATTPEAVSATPVARLAIPSAAEQASVRKLMREVFAEQLADTSIAARQKLADSLIAQAEKSNDVPVEKFVLLGGALSAATEAANLSLAFKAADRMAGAFDVKGPAVKAESVVKLDARRGGAELNTQNAKAGLALVDELLEGEDFASAERVCAALLQIPGASAVDVQKRQKEVVSARTTADRVAKHMETLKTSPDDPAANLEVGRYLCFTRGDLSTGLPMLAKGSDAKLKIAAERELAGGVDSADARVALADAWWDSAPVAVGPLRSAVLAHACEWYAKASPDLKGLNKLRVDKRLEASAKPTAGTTGSATATTGTPRRISTGFYRCMLGYYYKWPDEKKPYPYINLSIPAKALWSEPVKAQLRGKVTFDEIAYQSYAKTFVPEDGVYKLVADQHTHIKIDGKAVNAGDLELKKGVHEVNIEVTTHGGPYLEHASIDVTSVKTQKPLILYNSESDVKAFLKTMIGGQTVKEVSGWRLEDNVVDPKTAPAAPAVAAKPVAPATPAVTPAAGAFAPAPAGKGAQVEVEGAQWDTLRDGVAITGDARSSTAGVIPATLAGRSFSRLTGTPRLTFKVVTDGPVIMACTDRFEKSGNAGGNWKPEIIQRADLEKQGWAEIASIPIPGQNLNWVAYTRQCKAGETFTIRTEKYMNPFLIR